MPKCCLMGGLSAFFALWLAPLCAQGTLPAVYLKTAIRHEVSPSLIYAIALTEAGKTIEDNLFRPWPWTLTVNSKPKYFPSMNSMCAELLTLLGNSAQPEQLGVGLMQIEWRYHAERFEQASNACNPYTNLDVGVEILKSYIDEKGGVWEGVGRYHSGTPDKASAYQQRVAKNLVDYVLPLEPVYD